MRAYSCARISFAIVVVMAACFSGVAISPDEARAVEPDYKMVTSNDGGGTSGGGEWKTDPSGTGQLPVDEKGGRNTGRPGDYVRQVDAADASWVEEVQNAVVRMVRFVGAMFSQLY
jgi:hypothetical protein